MKKKMIIRFLVVGMAIILAAGCSGCSGFTKVTDAIVSPAARDIYKREFRDNKSLYASWNAAFQDAIANNALIKIPYRENGSFDSVKNVAYSYRFRLEAGEQVSLQVLTQEPGKRVFIDLFENPSRPIRSSDIDQTVLEYDSKETTDYLLVIQPEISADTKFTILINKKPSYGFPVAGKSNSDIGSFWSDPRDGGKRLHEGIDIFAKRGTPVVAVTEGIISFTGDQGLGGKQVWQRAGIFGHSIYYAHLNGIAISNGQKVKTGDTLGYVGNTGNAAGTPPHLHFGIYKNHGAVDPIKYVYKTKQISAGGFSQQFNASSIKIKSSKANIRISPNSDSDIVATLDSSQPLSLLGEHEEWLHVKTPANQRGFVHKSLVTAIN